MKWKNSDKQVLFFNYNIVYYNRTNNRVTDPMENRNYVPYIHKNGIIYPKRDLTNINIFESKTLKPESVLYFDAGSGFPRFKLSMTDSKRCIKIPKADYIIVSGNNDFKSPSYNYVVIEDNSSIYFVLEDDWNTWFNNSIVLFKNTCSAYHNFNGDPKVIYNGRVNSYTKESVWLAKYTEGEYSIPYLTDKQLDKIICEMCPEPTYEEFESILDMLNSEDASVVQLGVKMLTGYNVDKYKLSMRLILYTRVNWYVFTKNTVGTKQLIDTLDLYTYYICNDFPRGAYHAQKEYETYNAEDVAIAKKLGYKMIKEWLQNVYKRQILDYEFDWLPDERKVALE